ncbi:unnamed protein product [Rotaria sp. Silwood1]|nr:unnamed protein product [Rotaria sp. Silwood1]
MLVLYSYSYFIDGSSGTAMGNLSLSEPITYVSDIPTTYVETVTTKSIITTTTLIANDAVSAKDLLEDIDRETMESLRDALSDENERLQKQVIVLEHHVQLIEEQSSIEKETCPEEVDCTKSSTLSLDVLLSNLIKQTTAIAENTSTNLFDLFQCLSESLSDLVNHGHEYVKQSKQKLSDISRSQAAEQVQMALRCGVEHLSSSFSKAQSTYAT